MSEGTLFRDDATEASIQAAIAAPIDISLVGEQVEISDPFRGVFADDNPQNVDDAVGDEFMANLHRGDEAERSVATTIDDSYPDYVQAIRRNNDDDDDDNDQPIAATFKPRKQWRKWDKEPPAGWKAPERKRRKEPRSGTELQAAELPEREKKSRVYPATERNAAIFGDFGRYSGVSRPSDSMLQDISKEMTFSQILNEEGAVVPHLNALKEGVLKRKPLPAVPRNLDIDVDKNKVVRDFLKGKTRPQIDAIKARIVAMRDQRQLGPLWMKGFQEYLDEIPRRWGLNARAPPPHDPVLEAVINAAVPALAIAGAPDIIQIPRDDNPPPPPGFGVTGLHRTYSAYIGNER